MDFVKNINGNDYTFIHNETVRSQYNDAHAISFFVETTSTDMYEDYYKIKEVIIDLLGIKSDFILTEKEHAKAEVYLQYIPYDKFRYDSINDQYIYTIVFPYLDTKVE